MARRKRGELQVFSVSFLDVISCALGGVLLLLLVSTQQSAAKSKAFSKEVAEWRNKASQAMGKLGEAHKNLKDAEGELKDALEKNQSQEEAIEKFAQAMKDLDEAQHALLGFNGDLKNVVFVFDTSGSLAKHPFDTYCDYLESLVKFIPYEKFNVIDFDDGVTEKFPGKLADRNQKNIDEAATFIDGFIADTGTSTLAAMRAATALPDVDTIILFSDGAPSDAFGDDIIAEVVARSQGKFTVNTVAFGDYLAVDGTAQPYAIFLQKLAKQTKGRFLPFD